MIIECIDLGFLEIVVVTEQFYGSSYGRFDTVLVLNEPVKELGSKCPYQIRFLASQSNSTG